VCAECLSWSCAAGLPRHSDCSRCCRTCSDSKITQIRTLFLHDCRDGGHCSPHGVFYRNNGSVLDSCEHRLMTSASLFAVSQRQIAASRARARKSRILCICASVHLCICASVHLCICASVHQQALPSQRSPVLMRRLPVRGKLSKAPVPLT